MRKSPPARRACTFARPCVEVLEDRLVPATLLPGFTEALVTTNSDLLAPTAMEFSPTGQMWVLEQTGQVKLVRNDGTTHTALTLTVDSTGERGLLGIAFDPSYDGAGANIDYVYLYYTTPRTSPADPANNRLSRFTVAGAGTTTPTLGSELLVRELPPEDADNNPATDGASNHNGGAIHFGLDGKLYVAVGDHGYNNTPQSAHVSQSLATPFGKMLRLNANGTNAADNPFYTGSANDWQGAIWALGLRNPYTFAVQPVTGMIYINDVGQQTWEEINQGQAAANYGWAGGTDPLWEGFESPPPPWANYRNPLLAYDHSNSAPSPFGCAITGGVFYPQGSLFGDAYAGKYFFADFCGSFIRVFDPANPGTVSTPDTSTAFASNPSTSLIVDLKVDAAGNLYYLARGSGAGEIYRISLTTTILQHPANQTVYVGQSASFSVNAIAGAPIGYEWQKLIGATWTNIASATAATYTVPSTALGDAGQYRVIVTGSTGPATSNPATLTVSVPGPLLFTDDFNRTSSSNLGANWTETVGDLAIQGNAVTNVGGGVSNVATYNGTSASDVVVQANATIQTNLASTAGLFARYRGPADSNMYWAGLVASNGQRAAEIWRNSGGTWTRLTSRSVTSSSALLRFEVQANSLKLFLNGTLTVSAVDSTITEPGLAGVRMHGGGTIDNFSLYQHPVPTFPFNDDFSAVPNASDPSDLGQYWTETAGNVQVQSGFVTGTGGSINIAAYNGGAAADVSVRAVINVPANNFYAGLFARYRGPGDTNMYWAGIVSSNGVYTAMIYRNLNGAWTQLTSQAVATGAGTLRFDVRGPSLQLFHDTGAGFNLVASTVDGAITGAGLAGIRCQNGATADEFNLSVLTQTAAFSDNFNRDNNTNLDAATNAWTETAGNLTIQGNAVAGTGGLINIAAYNGGAAADVSVRAMVNVPNNSYAGLFARYRGPGDSNMYWAGIVGSNGAFTATIFRNLNGAWTQLTSQTVATGAGTLRFDVRGPSLQLFYDTGAGFNLIASTVDGAITAAGLAGIRCQNGASVDEFNISVLTQTAAFSDNFNRDNSTNLDAATNAWTETAGNLIIQSNVVTGTAGLINIAAYNGGAAADVSVRALVNVPNNSYAGLFARYSGPGDSNMYWAGIISSNGAFTATIYRNLNGAWTQLTSQTVATGAGTLRFDLLGPSLQLLYDTGTGFNLIASTVDGAITGAGLAGIRCQNGASIDDFNLSTP